ncbi:hypothetical protein [Metabacillus sp. 84]|uniref:hypothetical protein n=1 Tax=unclassified Metabacillus TaxID=2675274 RepID=UPI003CE7E66C
MSMEEKAARYRKISLQIKELESEQNQLKEELNAYLDGRFGENQKGKMELGEYVVQRQIRSLETYAEDTLIARLEALKLEDCIRTVKKPDKDKIEAALTLGLVSGDDLKDCIKQKMSKVLIIKEK